jgi:hypothetical protein|tara:strand:- start:4041 stop:4262 length:222 start_codon:yes stop_codon:yes gene_type:complete
MGYLRISRKNLERLASSFTCENCDADGMAKLLKLLILKDCDSGIRERKSFATLGGDNNQVVHSGIVIFYILSK